MLEAEEDSDTSVALDQTRSSSPGVVDRMDASGPIEGLHLSFLFFDPAKTLFHSSRS